MDAIEFLKHLPDKSVDMFFTDPPYGNGTTHNKWDVIIPPEPMWEQIKRTAKPNAVVLMFGLGLFTAQMGMSNPEWYKYNIIWKKTTPTGHLNAKKMPMRIHEDIMVFYNKPPTYNPQKTIGHIRKVSKAEHKVNCMRTSNYGKHGLTTYDSTERYPTDVWEFATDKQKIAWHPTQKPLELCKYAIKTYSNPDDLVVDFCCGAGTIPQAARLTGRRYIGTDNVVCDNPKNQFNGWAWADVTKYRIENLDY